MQGEQDQERGKPAQGGQGPIGPVAGLDLQLQVAVARQRDSAYGRWRGAADRCGEKGCRDLACAAKMKQNDAKPLSGGLREVHRPDQIGEGEGCAGISPKTGTRIGIDEKKRLADDQLVGSDGPHQFPHGRKVRSGRKQRHVPLSGFGFSAVERRPLTV